MRVERERHAQLLFEAATLYKFTTIRIYLFLYHSQIFAHKITVLIKYIVSLLCMYKLSRFYSQLLIVFITPRQCMKAKTNTK
jgi:hypothetical protein